MGVITIKWSAQHLRAWALPGDNSTQEMSYYRYITGVYKSYQPGLNRALRSSSVPRHVPRLEVPRSSRASSVPPCLQQRYEHSWRYSATPFRDRATSVPPAQYRFQLSGTISPSVEPEIKHYTDFDCKVIDYMNRLERQDHVKTYV